MNSISLPDGPILVAYNEHTDELGITADGWDLVAIANFVVFSRLLPHADDFESYEGGYKWTPDGPVMPKFGYLENGTVVVEKGLDWQIVGTF